MEDRFAPLNLDDEVLSVENSEKIIITHPMFKIGQFMAELKNILRRHGNPNPTTTERWFNEGINCEILKFGAKSWQKEKVKIRISLEFCLDKPAFEETAASNQLEAAHSESPLDDLRQMMHENS